MKDMKQAHEKDLNRLMEALNEYDFSCELKLGMPQLRRTVFAYAAGFLQYKEVPFSVVYEALGEWCENYFDEHVKGEKR